jgi:hypothetical protein
MTLKILLEPSRILKFFYFPVQPLTKFGSSRWLPVDLLDKIEGKKNTLISDHMIRATLGKYIHIYSAQNLGPSRSGSLQPQLSSSCPDAVQILYFFFPPVTHVLWANHLLRLLTYSLCVQSLCPQLQAPLPPPLVVVVFVSNCINYSELNYFMFWKLRGLIITALTITLCVAPMWTPKILVMG